MRISAAVHEVLSQVTCSAHATAIARFERKDEEERSRVSRVWFTFTLNDVFPEIDPDAGTDPEEEPLIDDSRIDRARTYIAGQITEHFPNATDVIIHETGWDGDWGQLSPRAESEDGTPYDPFLDWMMDVCGHIATAF